jgi:yecA family protein
MTDTTHLPDFINVDDALKAIHIPFSAAEAHGFVAGILSVTNDPKQAHELLLTEGDVADLEEDEYDVHQETLHELINISAHQFADINFGFHLLLPDDDIKLSVRTTSLGKWCQGYISGLGAAHLNLTNSFADELTELIYDLTEIGKIGSEDIQDTTEEDETDYAELMEFVRVAVMTIHADLMLESKPLTQTPASDKIH